MALDHSRLGLENKSGRIFCVRQVYFTKSCQQVWGRVNQPFILFIHYIWGETVLWNAVFFIQTSERMQCFTILQYKLYSFNIQDDRSTRGILAKPLKKKKSKITYTASRFSLLTSAKFAVRAVIVWMNTNRVTLQHIYLLLAEFSVRTVNYGPSFFPPIYGPSAKRGAINGWKKTRIRNL